ncbi:MAG: hypothetical protein ABW169_17390 [Sphingobium sp.]
MSNRDSAQHSSIGVGGSNNPAANPGPARPAKTDNDPDGQITPAEANDGESDQKGQQDPDKGSQR